MAWGVRHLAHSEPEQSWKFLPCPAVTIHAERLEWWVRLIFNPLLPGFVVWGCKGLKQRWFFGTVCPAEASVHNADGQILCSVATLWESRTMLHWEVKPCCPKKRRKYTSSFTDYEYHLQTDCLNQPCQVPENSTHSSIGERRAAESGNIQSEKTMADPTFRLQILHPPDHKRLCQG